MSTILTLRLDPASQLRFNQLREAHYPPALNRIAAHVTLFHTLPDDPAIPAELVRAASSQPPFRLAVTGLRSLGGGVAYTLRAAQLLHLHQQLSTAFADHLSPQDRQRFQPHIVVQNKVRPETARTLLAQLQASFAAQPAPQSIEAIGLDLWHYLGGPWQHAQTFPFAAS